MFYATINYVIVKKNGKGMSKIVRREKKDEVIVLIEEKINNIETLLSRIKKKPDEIVLIENYIIRDSLGKTVW